MDHSTTVAQRSDNRHENQIAQIKTQIPQSPNSPPPISNESHHGIRRSHSDPQLTKGRFQRDITTAKMYYMCLNSKEMNRTQRQPFPITEKHEEREREREKEKLTCKCRGRKSSVESQRNGNRREKWKGEERESDVLSRLKLNRRYRIRVLKDRERNKREKETERERDGHREKRDLINK